MAKTAGDGHLENLPVGRRSGLARARETTERERSSREVYVRGHGFVDAAVVHRSALEPGEVIAGPAVIQEEGATLFVEPGMTVERLPQGALLVETRAGR